MNKYNTIGILIPSLNPDNKLIYYIEGLIDNGIKDIIIINDGSKQEYEYVFNEIEKKSECIVLRHHTNQGKGRALKTGFDYFLREHKEKTGLITADADGQHSVEDTIKMIEELIENKNSLILWSRDFNNRNVPLRSKFGNKMTTIIFSLLYGKKIGDTQTWLRGIPRDMITNIMVLKGERFEYEINMLIDITKNKREIREITIETIYIDGNRGTHFRIADAIKIYSILFRMFLKILFSGILISLIDIWNSMWSLYQ